MGGRAYARDGTDETYVFVDTELADGTMLLRGSSRLAAKRVASVSTRHAALLGVQQSRGLAYEVARLFTPGPLTTSASVKEAMQKDLGSRAPEMVSTVAEVRSELLAMAHVSQEAGYECVIMQGSGTFAVCHRPST